MWTLKHFLVSGLVLKADNSLPYCEHWHNIRENKAHSLALKHRDDAQSIILYAPEGRRMQVSENTLY